MPLIIFYSFCVQLFALDGKSFAGHSCFFNMEFAKCSTKRKPALNQFSSFLFSLFSVELVLYSILPKRRVLRPKNLAFLKNYENRTVLSFDASSHNSQGLLRLTD